LQTRLRRSVALVAGVLLLVPGSALAKNGPGNPGSSAAVQQYVEQIPTSTGSHATGFGKTKTKPLAPAVQHRLTSEGGRDAPLLQQVATSSAYGAPQETLRTSVPVRQHERPKVVHRGGRAKRAPSAPRSHVRLPDTRTKPTPSRALSAVGSVVTDGSDGRLIALAIFLAVITATALGAAAYRQRAQRQPPGR
jgi:hypothetical protein